MSRVLRARPAGLSGSDISTHLQGTTRQGTRRTRKIRKKGTPRNAPRARFEGSHDRGYQAHDGGRVIYNRLTQAAPAAGHQTDIVHHGQSASIQERFIAINRKPERTRFRRGQREITVQYIM